MNTVPMDDLSAFDCVVIITNHSELDYGRICEQSQLVVDTRNATRDVRGPHQNKVITL